MELEKKCKYHPLKPATYFCYDCEISGCDDCVDDSPYNSVVRCFQCNKELETLGPGHIEPFWRRLQKSFRYPLATQSLVFILALSVLCSVVIYLPFALLIYLALFGTGFKYCFSCLSHTADGYMTPPDITEAYSGGLKTILILILMLFLTGLVTYYSNKYLGAAIGGVMALLVTLSFPAIIINYAITDDVFESLNPVNVLKLVNSIGLPYGLILAFIMIMSGSVAVMYQLVLWLPSGLDGIFLYAVTFYYLIVLHHLMGYMVFQFQSELGLSARLQGGSNKRRPNNEIALAKINTLVKEVELTEATALFKEQLQMNEDHLQLNTRFFEFLLSCNNSSELTAFLPRYLTLLAKQNRQDMISRNFKRVLLRIPSFKLEDPALRLMVSQASFEGNDPQIAIKLLHGIHKTHPEFKDLIPAMSLLADALDEYPKYADHASACRKVIVKLSRS